MVKTLKYSSDFCYLLVCSFHKHRGSQLAGNLTFTSLFALVPLLTLVFSIAALMPAAIQFGEVFRGYVLSNLAPPVAGKVLTIYVTQFVEHAGHLTLIGLGLFLISAVLLIRTVDQALAQIFVAHKRWRLLWRTLGIYLFFLVVGPVALGLILLAIAYVVNFASNSLSVAQWFLHWLAGFIPIVVTAWTLAVLYYLVPRAKVLWRHALIGGMIAATLTELVRSAFAWYLKAFPTLKLIYGAISVIPISLMWLYLCWLVVIIGAEITAALPWWKKPRQQAWKALHL